MNIRIINGFASLALLAILGACSSESSADPSTDPQALIGTDRNFCLRSQEAGMKVAFVEYADSESSKWKMDNWLLSAWTH